MEWRAIKNIFRFSKHAKGQEFVQLRGKDNIEQLLIMLLNDRWSTWVHTFSAVRLPQSDFPVKLWLRAQILVLGRTNQSTSLNLKDMFSWSFKGIKVRESNLTLARSFQFQRSVQHGSARRAACSLSFFIPRGRACVLFFIFLFAWGPLDLALLIHDGDLASYILDTKFIYVVYQL